MWSEWEQHRRCTIYNKLHFLPSPDDAQDEASTGGGCGTPCIIGIVLAVVGAIILVAVVAAVAYGIFSYLNHPDTKMAKFDNENFNG